MTYRIAIWRLLFSVGNLLLARAAVKASSCNGFGSGKEVRQLNVPVRVWSICAVGLPRAGKRRAGCRDYGSGLFKAAYCC
jgi:hypothetical protein